MSVTGWCIRNNRTFTVLILCLVFLGITTYRSISRLENPEFTIRLAVVATYFPGASPQKVEQLVTEKLETKIREIAEVEHVKSRSLSGASFIYVEVFDRYTDMKPVWDRLRDKVNDAMPDLPQGIVGPFVKDEFGDVYGHVVALTGDGYSYREMKDVAEDVRDDFLAMDDVAKVQLHGIQPERVFIEFSDSKLAELGTTPKLLVETLAAQNAIAPAGSALVGPERVVVEATGEFESLDELRSAAITIPGQAANIVLSDVAEVRRGYADPPEPMARYNGEKAVILAVSMAEGGNIVELGERMTAKLEELTARLPVGLDLDMVVFQPKFVERAINDFMINLLEAFAFVFLVMLVFTGFRTAMVAGTLVPLAILMCISLMPLFDTVLQQVSIASLIIALGMLVDNGVVVSENIMVRMARGEDRLQAAVNSAKKLWLPLLGASLTTIFAFLPIAIAESDVGEYTFSLFTVITLTLLSSWVLSMTYVPFSCYWFLKPKPGKQAFQSRIYRAYRTFLVSSLKRRWLFAALALGLTLFAVWAFRFVPTIFFPPNERDMFVIELWQPYGTDIEATSERTARLEGFLLEQEGVDSVGTFVGNGGPRWYLALSPEQSYPNYAFLVVNTETEEVVDRVMSATRDFLSEHLPDARPDVKALENGPPVGAPIQIRISGDDMDTLYDLRGRVAEVLADTPGVTDIWDDWGEWTKKLVIRVDQENAKRAGVNSRTIAGSVRALVSGHEITRYREGDETIPVVARAREEERVGLGKLRDATIYAYETEGSVPLSQVAETELDFQPGDIRRRDHTRTMTVKANVQGRFASEVLAGARPRIESMVGSEDWPYGYRVEYGGEFEESNKAQASIRAGLPLALALIVLVLVAQFNSIRRTLIIALTVPPMMVGITFGLLATSAPFGFMAMLGMISLLGIIVNNALILLDQVEIERGRGLSVQDAVVMAAQKRLRPIVMTACTTVIGLIPLSLQGGEMWRPMANTIIFGLSFATVLTLGLTPVLYALFFKARFDDYRYTPVDSEEGD